MRRFRLTTAGRPRAAVVAAALLVAAATAGPALAIGPIVRIEQDWEITLGTLDPTTGHPQIIIPIRPDVNNQDFGGVLLINFSDAPNFVGGGIQTQIWDHTGTVCVAASNSTASGRLSRSGEKLKFTVYFETNGTSTLSMGIDNAVKSVDWGDWTKARLDISGPCTVPSFTNYSLRDTADTTQILCGSDKVKSMVIKMMRVYDKAKTKQDLGGVTVY